MCAQGKMIEFPFDLQAFQSEERIQHSKDRIVLGHHAAYGRFAQGGILVEQFVEDF